MAVNIKDIDKEGLHYDVLPEYIPPSLVEELREEREINSTTDGYSPDRTMRKIASIDPGVMYNYAMMNDIPPNQHAEYWAVDKGKNLLSFLEEFPVFKVVDKPL